MGLGLGIRVRVWGHSTLYLEGVEGRVTQCAHVEDNRVRVRVWVRVRASFIAQTLEHATQWHSGT